MGHNSRSKGPKVCEQVQPKAVELEGSLQLRLTLASPRAGDIAALLIL